MQNVGQATVYAAAGGQYRRNARNLLVSPTFWALQHSSRVGDLPALIIVIILLIAQFQGPS